MPVTNLCKLLQRLDTTDAQGQWGGVNTTGVNTESNRSWNYFKPTSYCQHKFHWINIISLTTSNSTSNSVIDYWLINTEADTSQKKINRASVVFQQSTKVTLGLM